MKASAKAPYLAVQRRRRARALLSSGLPPVFQDAEALWDTRYKSCDSSSTAPLIDLMRNSHDLHLGSLRSAYIGNSQLNLPGTTGNYGEVTGFTRPLQPGDTMIEVEIRTPFSQGQATNQTLCGQWGAVGNRSFLFYIDSLERPAFIGSTDGTATFGGDAGTLLPNGFVGWLAVTRVQATGEVEWFTRPLGGTYTKFGSTLTSNTGALYDSSDYFGVGQVSGQVGNYLGAIGCVILRDGINGTIVLDANFGKPDYTQSFPIPQGGVVTIKEGGVDNNNPIWLPYCGESHLWLPGTAGNGLTISGLQASTLYNYTILYTDSTTASGSGTADAGGNLTLGDTDPNFATKSVFQVVESGSAIFDFDARRKGGWAENDLSKYLTEQGQTVTINRSTSGYKSVVVYDRGVYALATDDYMEADDADALDIGTGESYTAVAAHRMYETIANSAIIIAKRGGYAVTDVGWQLQVRDTPRIQAQIADGTTAPAAGATSVPGNLQSALLVRDAAGPNLTVYADDQFETVPDGTGNLSNALSLRVGRLSGTGGGYLDMEFVGGAVFRRVLTDEEITQVVDWFKQVVSSSNPSSGFTGGFSEGFG